MKIDITTPSLVFSATSLLMLAYTNKFLTIAGLVRDLINTHHNTQDELILKQIENLQTRLTWIRLMQLWGAISFFSAITSMFLQMFENIPNIYPTIVFVFSLIAMLLSLTFLVKELAVSNDALNFQLETLKKEKSK